METLSVPGRKAMKFLERDKAVISPSYPRASPFVMDHGVGSEIWDVDDRIEQKAFQLGFRTLGCGVSNTRIAPPLNISQSLVDEGLQMFEASITEVEKEGLD